MKSDADSLFKLMDANVTKDNFKIKKSDDDGLFKLMDVNVIN